MIHPGLLLPAILLALLAIREFLLAAGDPRWRKVSSVLLVPILVFFALFLIQVMARIDTFTRQEEYRDSLIQGLDISIFTIEQASPTPYQPVSKKLNSAQNLPRSRPGDPLEPTPEPMREPGSKQALKTPDSAAGSPAERSPDDEVNPLIPLVTGIPLPNKAPERLNQAPAEAIP